MKKALLLIALILMIITASVIAVAAFSEAASSGTEPQTTGIDVVKTTPSVNTTAPATSPIGSTVSTQVPSTPQTTTPKITTPSIPSITTTPAPITTPSLPSVDTDPSKLGFKADMSAFEKYMNPTGDDWSDNYLLLANAANPIEKDIELSSDKLDRIISSDTITAYRHTYKPFKLNETALQALTAMFIEAKAEGVSNLHSVSAYRDYSYQKNLFNSNVNRTGKWHCSTCDITWIGKNNVCSGCGRTISSSLEISREEKEKNVATYSCRPGTSDHQTGLAVDIIQSSLPDEYHHLVQKFGDTEAGKWLAANAHKFGFVLRFPADKEEITGIIYEPWHFRYVGREHATRMYEMNLCLEEYIDYLTQIGYFN